MKTPTKKDNIFRLPEQDGPFATEETVPEMKVFSPFSRRIARSLKTTQLSTRYRFIRDQIYEFLNVTSFYSIHTLIKDVGVQTKISRRVHTLLGNMFGLEGSERETRAAITGYAKTADGVIQYLKNTVLSPYDSYFDMTNRISSVNDPVDLLLIPFDDRYHKKSRFEAKRKLILMSLAAAIEQRERETNIEQRLWKFLDFLDEHVWGPEAKIGEREPTLLLSRHCPDDFSCSEVSVIAMEELSGFSCLPSEPGVKKTLIRRLWFNCDGKKIPIYVTVRQKNPVAKVLKLIRKDEENPDVAVDDELGLMGVLDGLAEVRLFQKHLVESASRANSFLTLEDVSNSQEGETRLSTTVDSAPKNPMLKFFARMGGMRVEFIIHTNSSFLNYIYQKCVAHNEYEVRRLFDTGVTSLLFPKDINLFDVATIRDDLLNRYRRQIEHA